MPKTRTRMSRRGAPEGLLLTAKQFNQLIKIGTKVRFYPVAGRQGFKETRTRSEAWELGHGEAVVKVDGIAGGVAVSHLELMQDQGKGEQAPGNRKGWRRFGPTVNPLELEWYRYEQLGGAVVQLESGKWAWRVEEGAQCIGELDSFELAAEHVEKHFEANPGKTSPFFARVPEPVPAERP